MVTTNRDVLPPLRDLETPDWTGLFEVGESGRVRVAGTRVPIERVIYFHSTGMTLSAIAEEFPGLDVEVVARVLEYHASHRDAVDRYVRSLDAHATQVLAASIASVPASIRERFETIQSAIRSATD